MKKVLLGSAVLFGVAVSAAAVWAQGAAPKSSTTITAEDVQKVLKLGPKETDHTIKVVEMGQNYQMSVAVVHRDSSRNRPAPTPEAAKARAAAQAKLAACAGKAASAPAGAKTQATGMLSHDDTAETYIIIKGAGTLVTGGTLYNAKRDAADSPMTTTLNGPSCTGGVFGDFKTENVKVGDIIVIPAGVPHGWSDIPQMVDYLSVRPDPKHVLPKAGYIYPGL